MKRILKLLVVMTTIVLMPACSSTSVAVSRPTTTSTSNAASATLAVLEAPKQTAAATVRAFDTVTSVTTIVLPTPTASSKPATVTPLPIPPSTSEYPEVVTTVRLYLARQLDTLLSSTKVVSFTAIDWPDSCLGVHPTNVACSNIVTPGYLIILQAAGNRYEYHTDGNAGIYVQISASTNTEQQVTGEDMLLSWHREGGLVGFCDNVLIDVEGKVLISLCKGRKSPVERRAELDADQMKQINEWANRLRLFSVAHAGPVSPDELVIEYTFTGHGTEEPTAMDKQAISLFVQKLMNSIK